MDFTSRREFLKQAGTISACICCFGAVGFFNACAPVKKIETTETNDAVALPLASFADKNYVTIQTKKFEQPLLISKQTDGTYAAVLMLCTHKGCGLNAAPDKLVCPCHGSEFSQSGAVLAGPAKQPLQKFRVTTTDKDLEVHFL